MHQEVPALDSIVDSMKLRFKSLKKQRDAAVETADHLFEELQKVRSAWGALVDESELPVMPARVHDLDAKAPAPEAAPAAEASPGTTRKSRPTLKAPEVRDIAISFLAEGEHEGDEVLKRCGEVAEERGLSRKGLHFVVRRLLREAPEFEETSDGKYRLVPGKISLAARVKATLTQLGPLTEQELKKRVAAIMPGEEFEPRFRSVMRGEDFEFNGSRWALRSRS